MVEFEFCMREQFAQMVFETLIFAKFQGVRIELGEGENEWPIQ